MDSMSNMRGNAAAEKAGLDGQLKKLCLHAHNSVKGSGLYQSREWRNLKTLAKPLLLLFAWPGEDSAIIIDPKSVLDFWKN